MVVILGKSRIIVHAYGTYHENTNSDSPDQTAQPGSIDRALSVRRYLIQNPSIL